MMIKRRSLTTRLFHWYLWSFLIFLSISFLITWFTVSHVLDREIDAELVEDATEIRKIYRAEQLRGVQLEFDREASDESESGEFYRLLGADGQERYRFGNTSIQSWPDLLPGVAALQPDDNQLATSTRQEQTDEGDIETVQYREIFFRLDDQLIGHIGESIQQKSEIVNTLRNAFLMILALIVPIAGLLAKIVVGNTMKGIRKVSETARRIQRGELNERANLMTRDKEVFELSKAFNTMLDCVRDLVTEMRDMTDNIAHDLKSPLARIRFMAEMTLSRTLARKEKEEIASKTIDECDRLLKMIDTSLDVAEAEAGFKPDNPQTISFSETVQDACELFEPVAEQKRISLDYKIESNCFVTGSLSALQRMVSNILDNALKYCDAGDRVCVKLRRSEETLILDITDSGMGIPQCDQDKVFKRFFRCDRSRSRDGCGLGLSFSRAIARQNGGDIRLTSELGQGSRFSLTIPLHLGCMDSAGYTTIGEDHPHSSAQVATAKPDFPTTRAIN